jgi:hypothetical protein
MIAEAFKKLAFKYLRLSDQTRDDADAARLRLLAADYWEKGLNAEGGTTQQQQQIQPDKENPS